MPFYVMRSGGVFYLDRAERKWLLLGSGYAICSDGKPCTIARRIFKTERLGDLYQRYYGYWKNRQRAC